MTSIKHMTSIKEIARQSSNIFLNSRKLKNGCQIKGQLTA